MFRNYFKIAYRNLIRNKAYSLINIGGLSIGIAACLLITLYVAHEYSYDSFHKNAGRIYSVYARMTWGGGGDTSNYPLMTYPTGPGLLKADPDVESFVRLPASFGDEKLLVQSLSSPEKKFREASFLFADSNFFSFFSFPLRRGDPGEALSRPFTVVLSERMAKKYFGDVDPVGRLLKYDSLYTFEITGVAAEAPSNSTIHYDFVASLSSKLAMGDGKSIREEQDIMYGTVSTFVLLKKGADPRNTEAILKKMVARNMVNKDDKSQSRYFLLLQQATHLFYDGFDQSNIRYLHLFMLAGGLILMLALINYMSLATAKATLRAKEIGVRKVIGAGRPTIAWQFYIESALYAGIAFVLGFVLFRLVQPYFFNRIELPIDASFLFQPRVLGIFAALLLMTILIAGSYPSLVLSSFNPVTVLYGRLSKQRGGAGIRRFFIVLQFFISVGMIIGSLVIERQMYFFRHTDTGVNRENVVMIPFRKSLGDHYQSFRNEVRQVAGITGVATSIYPMYGGYSLLSVTSPGSQHPHPLVMINVDEQFIPLLHIQWLFPPKGSSNYIQDKQIIINEAAIGQLNLSPNPLGEVIRLDDQRLVIAGVVKSFNYASLRSKIDAQALFVEKDTAIGWGKETGGCLFARIGPHVNVPTVMETVRKIYDRYDVTTPFSFEFMDDAFAAAYKAEDRLADIFSLFTALMIVIACLGLFGLVAFSATQRTREIGIRKILGASIQSIMGLMAKEFVFYIFIAILIAIPVTYYAISRWLDNFAYKIPLGWELFGLAGASTIGLALLTIGGIAFKAAKANPAENLRTE